ncbi:hypothetical protein J6590_108086, partial [Homalodisca vitripennis]
LITMPPKKSPEVVGCPVCIKAVMDEDDAIQCDFTCQRWFHIKCIGMPKAEYSKYSSNNNMKWPCSRLDCSALAKHSPSDVWDKLNTMIGKIDALNNK